MSFNLRNMLANDGDNGWELRKSSICSLINDQRPDIIGTQEGYFPQIEHLSKNLPEYYCVAIGRDDGIREGETCALFLLRARFEVIKSCTFWFSETPDIPGSRHWTRHHPRICTWANIRFAEKSTSDTLMVYNVHLDHESQIARENSCRMLRDRIDEAGNSAIVMGDFNMEPDNAGYAIMTQGEQGLLDSYRVAYPQLIRPGTFHDFTGRTDMESIDYIFVTRDLTVTDSAVLTQMIDNRYPSDHYPITAKIST